MNCAYLDATVFGNVDELDYRLWELVNIKGVIKKINLNSETNPVIWKIYQTKGCKGNCISRRTHQN